MVFLFLRNETKREKNRKGTKKRKEKKRKKNSTNYHSGGGERADQLDDAHDDGGQVAVHTGAGILKDGHGVEDDGVDSAQLLEKHQGTRHDQRLDNGAVRQGAQVAGNSSDPAPWNGRSGVNRGMAFDGSRALHPLEFVVDVAVSTSGSVHQQSLLEQ